LISSGQGVVRAQAGFDVGHRHSFVEARQRCGERGGGVALDDQPIRSHLAQHARDPLEYGGCHIAEILSLSHDVEVMVGLDLEYVEHLVQHLPMLTGDAGHLAHAGLPLQRLYHWGQLDRFGAGAEDG
jgi:hypothetical protein